MRERILLTSALPYINGVKHLGNAVGSMLPADVFARFQRARGSEVLFICATDEHGTPAELAAAEAGQDVRTYCDEQHELQKAVYAAFDFSFDHFGRSSSAENRSLTQHFGDRLDQAELLAERTSTGLFCVDDSRFLPDRYVEGICPVCGTDGARGDQCDTCGSLLDPVDLIQPRSKISGSTRIEVRETVHLFLRQQVMADRIRQWVDANQNWPRLTKSIAYKWLDEGLKDRSITRDLSWGVPVTKDGKIRPGFENKVYYVWFDAPICYIAATQEWAAATGGDWERWWRTDKGAHDVHYIQVMGKDNVAFHTVSFPITLFGSGEPWKLVDSLKAFNWLNWYGGKFSTSRGRGIFMDTALELLPADAWRWALISNAPENADTAFTLELLRVAINDLANVLGNFVVRLTRFCSSAFDGVVPGGGAPGEREAKLADEVAAHIAAVTDALEAMECRKAAVALRALWASANAYLARAAPWTAIGANADDAALAIRMGLGLMTLLARVSQPIIPHTAQRILDLLPDEAPDLAWPNDVRAELLAGVRPGGRVLVSAPLFDKLTDDKIADWERRFNGVDQAAVE